MAIVEVALTAAVISDPGFSGRAVERFFPKGGRQDTGYPYATYQRISTAGADHLDGPRTLEWPRFQIDSWGRTAIDALELAAAIRNAIDNITVDGDPPITATFLNQSGPALDEETRNFRVSQDYFVFHERP